MIVLQRLVVSAAMAAVVTLAFAGPAAAAALQVRTSQSDPFAACGTSIQGW